MFMRSAKLAAIEGAGEGATGLRTYLQTLEPTTATEAATNLFGTFLDLIITFIGDRLTVQVLRGAWPAIDETTSKGNPKNA